MTRSGRPSQIFNRWVVSVSHRQFRQCLIFQLYMLLNDLAFSFEQHIEKFILNVSVRISLFCS